jgi:hypothetical protein
MLLAIGHDNAQFISLPFDGVFFPVHGAEIEHSGSCRVAFERLGHSQQNLISEEAQFVKGVPKAPLALWCPQMTGPDLTTGARKQPSC